MKKIVIALFFALALSVPSVKVYALQNDGTEMSQNMEDEVLKLCKWYISTPISKDPEQIKHRQLVAAEILTYGINTQKFTLSIGKPVTDLLESTKHQESADLLGVYIAGEIIYCLEHNLNESDANSFASSMGNVVNFYSKMENHPIKSLNKYLKMTEEKRIEAFVKLYNKSK